MVGLAMSTFVVNKLRSHGDVEGLTSNFGLRGATNLTKIFVYTVRLFCFGEITHFWFSSYFSEITYLKLLLPTRIEFLFKILVINARSLKFI